MANKRESFADYTPFSTNKRVYVGNSEALEAEGVGTVVFQSRVDDAKTRVFSLIGVLYVPGLSVNLLSIGKAASNGIQVVFAGNECRLSYQSDVIARGEKVEDVGLYKLGIKPRTETALLMKSHRPAKEWHKSLVHANMDQIKNMQRKGLASGMNLQTEENEYNCPECHLGKAKRVSHPASNRPKAVTVGQVVHTDLIGKISPTGLGGSNFILLLTDEYSGYRTTYCLKRKDEVATKIQEFITKIEVETGNKLRALHTDNGTEFVNAQVQFILNLEHVMMLTSAPYTPQQNGAAERSNRTLIESMRTLLNSTTLPRNLWEEAAYAATYLLNMVTTDQRADQTPYEGWFGRKPSLAHVHPWGTPIQILDHNRTKAKFDPKTKCAYLVGYTKRSNTYRCYVPDTNNVKITSDVVFSQYPEEPLGMPTKPNDKADQMVHICQTCPLSGQSSEPEDENTEIDENLQSEDDHNSTATEEYNLSNLTIKSTNGVTDRDNANSDDIHRESTVLENRPEPGESMLTLGNLFSTCLLTYVEPQSFHSAISGREGALWREAIETEVKALLENNTWSIVDKQDDIRPLTAKWVFKRKMLPCGEIDKYKARLVARGFNQIYGVDFVETFAPVASYDTVRILLALSVQAELEVVQFDVASAFLNGTLEEDVYLFPPPGVECPRDKVLKLNKSIYGLKQAPKCWHSCFGTVLRALGLEPTSADPCLFHGHYKQTLIFLIVYVDDGLLMGKDREILMDFMTQLSKHMKVKTVESNCFIGLEFKKVGSSLIIHQKSYINKMMELFNMKDCVPAKTPIVDIDHLLTPMQTDTPSKAPYRELVGNLLFCSNTCRPDISFAVKTLSQFNEAPMCKHWTAAKHVLRYLKGTDDLGLVYRKGKHLEIDAYSDADWAGDCRTRRSTSGALINLVGGPVIFKSKTQSIVALSTTEAEYTASCMTAREICWLKGLLREIKKEAANCRLRLDNQGAIKLIKSPGHRARTKHLDIKMHYVREKQEAGEFSLEYIPSELQKADMLTKGLGPRKHQSMLQTLGMRSLASLMIFVATIACLLPNIAGQEFHAEDLVLWRETKISHVKGQIDLQLDIMFHDPCETLFSNATSIPRIDEKLVAVCSKNFRENIIDGMKGMCPSSRRQTRQAQATVIISAVSAVVSTIFQIHKNYKADTQEKDLRTLKELAFVLDDELKRTVLLSNERITDRLKEVIRDVEVLAVALDIQPEVDEALNSVMLKIHEVSTKIKKIKPHMQVGNTVPYEILEIFNLTHLATPSSLKHSTIHRCQALSENQYQVHISLLDISRDVEIRQADPFSYWSEEQGSFCKFVYAGPQHIPYNRTSDCTKALIHGEVSDDVLLGNSCPFRKNIHTSGVYEIDHCEKFNKHNINVPKAQVKHQGNLVYINCQGRFVTIDGTRRQCPNSIFSIREDKSFMLDEYSYVHQATNVSKPLTDFALPNKINILLGATNKEFNALTAEEIAALQNQTLEDSRKHLNEELTNSEPMWGVVLSKTGLAIDFVGEYIAICTLLLLVYLAVRTRMRNIRQVNSVAVVAIICLLPLIVAEDMIITVQLSQEEATNDISHHQEFMEEKWCNKWRFSDKYSEYEKMGGYYSHTLACTLALQKFTCPCRPTAEYVPILPHDQVSQMPVYTVPGCITEAQPDRNGLRQIKMLDVLSEHLCYRARNDRWPKDVLGETISAGCLLARKMYNCACTKATDHKSIILDALTRKATWDISSVRQENREQCSAKESESAHSSVYAMFFNKGKSSL